MVTPYDDKIELNIVVLDPEENIIKWLDADLCDIKETCAVNKCRQIELTYPIDLNDLNLEGGNWYDAGNKLYIPSTLGINSCLYVINADYDLDYWKKNTVSFTAEEVLTELNYNLVGFITAVTPGNSGQEGESEGEGEEAESVIDPDEDQIPSGEMLEKTYTDESQRRGTQIFKYKDKIEITSEVLTAFFGDYFDISGVDSLDEQKKYISPSGTMTYMSLLRLIEEQTERVFITEYVSNGHEITRRLNLRNYQNMRRTAQTELLDLNYNLDSLELNVSEEDTYTAMAPEFTDNSTVVQADTSQTVIDTGSELVNTAQNASSNVDTQTKSISEVISDWLDYEVEPRQEHPMIIQKDSAGNLVEVASWYAPFRKMAGSLEIVSERKTESQYNHITGYNNNITLSKCGKVSTSETIPQIIYNTLANALLNKLSPVYDLKIDVKDIQELMGIPNLSYELYETLQVRVPNFDYFVPCRITGTVKNPHKPGENKITVETDVKSIRNLHETEIVSSNMIVNDNNPVNIGGLLLSEEMGLPESLVTINIKLVQAFNDGTININTSTGNKNTLQQATTKFDPENNTYVFSQDTIMKVIRVHLYKWETEPEYASAHPTLNVRTVTGEVVTIPTFECYCILYAYWQNYDLNRFYAEKTTWKDKITAGKYDSTIAVHLYPKSKLDTELNLLWMMQNGIFMGEKRLEHLKKYSYSAFYHHAEELTTLYEHEMNTTNWDITPLNISSTSPTGVTGSCVPFALEMAFTAMLNFTKAGDLALVLDTNPVTGTSPGKVVTRWDNDVFGLPDIFAKKDGGHHVDGYNNTSFDNHIKAQAPLSELRDSKYVMNPRWVVIIKIGLVMNNNYFNGVYSLVNTEGSENAAHAIAITDWKVVNGVKYVYVQDINVPVFSLTNWGMTNGVLDGWIRWDVVDAAMTYYFEGSDMGMYVGRPRYGCSLAFSTYHNIPMPLDEDSVTQPSNNGGNELINLPIEKVEITPLDLTNNTYLFHSDAVQAAIEEVYKYYVEQGLRHDLNTISTNLLSVVGQKHTLKMKELMGLAYSYMYYYQNNSNRESSNIDLRYGKLEDSQKFIDHMCGDYDYFTPVYPQQKRYEDQYVVSSALFHLGVMSSPMDWFKGNLDGVSFDDMLTAITTKNNNLHCFIREASENMLRSVLRKTEQCKFKATVVVVYCYDNSLVSSSQYSSNRYPLLLYSLDGDTVAYCNIAGRGNSPGYNYNTSKTSYGASNPYGTVSMTDLLTWIDAAKENNPNNNNCLIVSRYLTEGSV